MLRYAATIAQIKHLNTRIMINFPMVTKEKSFRGISFSEVVVVDQRSDKETENQNLLPNLSFFKRRQLLNYEEIQK